MDITITKAQLFALVNKISTTPQNKTMWIERINNANNDELSGILTDLEYYP